MGQDAVLVLLRVFLDEQYKKAAAHRRKTKIHTNWF